MRFELDDSASESPPGADVRHSADGGSVATGSDSLVPEGLRFCLLGPLVVYSRGQAVTIGGARQRIVLATLLLESGRVLPTERLITVVWDDCPPTTARTQIHISISKLRSRLAALGMPDAIATHEAGYLIRVPDEALDITTFRRLVARARQARADDLPTAASTMRQALGLWRGQAADGINSRLVTVAALRLDEERTAVTEEWMDLELELGRHDQIIGHLRELVAAHPFREKLHGQLMLALYRGGRQAEALEVYRQAREVLVEEHGLDPGERLQELERKILVADPATRGQAVADAGPTVPRQLPAHTGSLVGRSGIAADMRALLTDDGNRMVLLSGAPGVGKTVLAVHVAGELAEYFPEGQLFAHLRGSDTRPIRPEEVLGQFLRAFGVPSGNLPTTLDALAGVYRSRLSGRRVLILLDDAPGAGVIAPLLPGDTASAVIVTSRRALAGLPGAQRFELDVFSPETSQRFLSEMLGEARVHAEPEAAAAVADSCGHLPLALQIAGAKLSVRRHWQIARMARRLADESRRLDELSLDGAGVRATISVSFEALDGRARRLLLLLGTLGGGEFAGWVAGPFLDTDFHDGIDVLDELVDARLVEVQVGTGHRTRYWMHDLVGVFARERLASEVPAADRIAAQERLVQCWLFLARQAHRREYGGDFTVLHSGAAHWRLPDDVADALLADPLTWFELEYANLVGAVRIAAELDAPELCWDLAVTLVTLFETRMYRGDWRETHELALEVVWRHADRRGEAAVRHSRAGLALVEQRFTAARTDLTAALAWFVEADDSHGRGLARRGLASIDRMQGRPDPARQQYEQALADLRQAGDLVAEAHVLLNLAEIHAEQTRHAQAELLLQRALELCEGVGARRVAAQVRHRLGQLYLARGELDRAETEFAEVLEAAAVADDPVGTAYALLGAGAVHLGRDDFTRASGALTDALDAVCRTGNRLGEGRVLLALAELAIRTGYPGTAADRLDRADEAFREIGAATWRERVDELRRTGLFHAPQRHR